MKPKNQSSSTLRPLFYSITQSAELLNVSRRTVEKMVAEGVLPSRRLRRRRMIPREYLEELAKVSE